MGDTVFLVLIDQLEKLKNDKDVAVHDLEEAQQSVDEYDSIVVALEAAMEEYKSKKA